jgi:hypothetical protein
MPKVKGLIPLFPIHTNGCDRGRVQGEFFKTAPQQFGLHLGRDEACDQDAAPVTETYSWQPNGVIYTGIAGACSLPGRKYLLLLVFINTYIWP